MPAVRRADRFTDFADAQLVELLFHFRRNVAGVEPAEVTAAGLQNADEQVSGSRRRLYPGET